MTVEETDAVKTFTIVKETPIDAPADVVFRMLFRPLGPLAEMKLTLEPWPGGRWFRDLGDKAGHLWGHVQVIKPPKLMEISGPMMMSVPAINHLQYRLTDRPGGTLLTLTHKAFGLLDPAYEANVSDGWQRTLDAIRAAAETA